MSREILNYIVDVTIDGLDYTTTVEATCEYDALWDAVETLRQGFADGATAAVSHWRVTETV